MYREILTSKCWKCGKHITFTPYPIIDEGMAICNECFAKEIIELETKRKNNK